MDQTTLDMLALTLSQAVTDVCSMMLGEDVTVGTPDVAGRVTDHAGDGVRGSIDITGDFTGEASIHLPTATAIKLVSAFVGVDIKPDDEAFVDAIGELANMVVGSAKANFEGLNCSISCPTVRLIVEASESYPPPHLRLPVTGESGDFAIEVLLAA